MRVAKNVLEKKMTPQEPNRCRADASTYIRNCSGWHNLAVWMGLFSRQVVD
jgi:hypothetical protein